MKENEVSNVKDENASTPMVHDPHGPSTHPYIAKCPAYVSTGGDNIHSVKGTFKHDLVYKLRHGEITRDEIFEITETPIGGYDFSEQDAEHVIDAAIQTEKAKKWFMEKVQADEEYELTEEFIKLPSLGISGGTPDFLMIADFDCALILDYKFGQIEVSPWTEQLMSYLTGLIKGRRLREVYSGIVQPLIRSNPWIVRIPFEHIKNHEKMMAEIILSAKSPNPPRVPHEKCSWCDLYPCTAVKALSNNAMVLASKNEGGDVTTMGDAELVALTSVAEKLKKLHGSLKEEIYHRLCAGQEVVEGLETSWVLRPGRGSRVWTDSNKAEAVMKELIPELNEKIDAKNAKIKAKNAERGGGEDPTPLKDKLNPMDLYEMKMISPAKADKLFGTSKAVKAELGKVVMKVEGKMKATEIPTPLEEKNEENK
jgi:hypothetical protein